MDFEGFADRIAKTCYDIYKNRIPNSRKPKAGIEWTLMAAVVMTTGEKSVSKLRVVSLATGSKCIGQSKMCPKGSVVNDSHAEVLARRGFVRFLIHQVELAFVGTSDILERTKEDDALILKPSLNVNFHLFTSHVPCGDAAIFPKSPQEEETRTEDTEAHLASKRARRDSSGEDIHRTGAKCVAGGQQDLLVDGRDYHIVGVLRTKPGRGDRTLSMSCTDKIARWNVLGLQGTLLMHFLKDPIYLTSIILGKCFFSEEALRRAIVERLDPICGLPPGYVKNSPKLLQSKLRFELARDDEFASDRSKLVPAASSIVWSDLPNRDLDVVVDGYKQGTTKKNRGSEKSRCFVSKYELFASFCELLTKENLAAHSNSAVSVIITKRSYEHYKLSAARNHQIAKQAFLKTFDTWTVKPAELNQFCLS